MAIRDVEVKIQLSELENVVMVAHSEAMKAAGLSPEGNMKAANITAVMVNKMRNHLTGVELLPEKKMARARMLDALSSILFEGEENNDGN